MRPFLKPLVPLYAAGLGWKNSRFDRGTTKVWRLGKPVISVGSLSAGGAGKTPVVLALLDLLQQHGIPADVLSRGYGRELKTALQVEANGPATEFGDETLMIARRGWPVFVAPQRFDAGVLAEQQTQGSRVHLLDDGMQHRQLARALDIALLTREDANDLLLPAGNLREPLESLRRAHVVVMREEEAAALSLAVHHYSPMARRWIIRRQLRLDGPLPERALAFCGIARPDGFFTMLKQLGVPLVAQQVFPDHHAYTETEIAALRDRAQQAMCDAILTTEKDAVKLPADMPRLRVAYLDAVFTDPATVWGDLQQLLNLG
ncbi:tetraacyldisaccharide 4'-kinase [Terriglobus tenax]|uniref:tetraacyldisaccharide 4'-kinase n=1 Tax=Terriglobus tenax TaxID=1111115 RepID=UPI0021DFC2E6|nr:tetraacyldisaccharide 4'-kinase [Terriglobus tenax]